MLPECSHVALHVEQELRGLCQREYRGRRRGFRPNHTLAAFCVSIKRESGQRKPRTGRARTPGNHEESTVKLSSIAPLLALLCLPPCVEAQYERSCGESCGSLLEGCQTSEQCPWTGSVTQTIDYGTNLTLPIGLTPANTLISPGGLGGSGIIDDGLLGGLGLLDNLIGGAPVADTPTFGQFRNDWMFRTTSTAQYQQQVGRDGQFSVGYTYYQNLHSRVEQLDLISHTVTAQYARRLSEDWTSAWTYNFAFYELDHDSLVSQNNIGYGLAYRPAGCWSYEVNASFNDSNFRGIDSLDAQFWSATAAATRKLNDTGTSYLTAGYQYGFWNARSSTFTYDLHSVYLTWQRALDRDGSTTLNINGSYGNYGFRGVDFIQQNLAREDDLFAVGATLARRLNDSWSIFTGYTYTDSESNVVRQDYSAHLFTSGLTFNY